MFIKKESTSHIGEPRGVPSSGEPGWGYRISTPCFVSALRQEDSPGSSSDLLPGNFVFCFLSHLSSFSSIFTHVCLFYPATTEQSKNRQEKEIPPLYKGAFCLNDAVLVTSLYALHQHGESDRSLLLNEDNSFLRGILVPSIEILNI